MHDPDVHFKRITAATVLDVCKLSHTLSDEQRRMVADNAVSLAQAAYSDGAWVRAIYADSDLVGFIMLHLGSDYDDGIDCPGVFLWRLMIAGPFQGKGYGARAIHRLLAHLRSMGMRELYTCCETGPAGPEGFYRRLGFEPTGDYYGDQPEYVLRLDE
ncbi:MAG: GNAT family N-acetyltransferase [Bacillota bacterium]